MYSLEEQAIQKEVLKAYLEKNDFITIRRAYSLLKTSRKYACFLLSLDPQFKKFYRSPTNSVHRKRVSWKLN